MAKSSNQKTRLLLVREILLRETDEDHRLTVPELVERLAARGVEVERKSLYDDMEALRAAGEDVQLQRGHNGGYCIGERLFELPELKLLVDAVQSSRFITAQKSGKLIKKLESLTSAPQARQLQRQVVVNGRVKTMNESIYYSVDLLHEAIARNSQITFRYFDWNLDGGRRYRPGKYTASPYALCWQDENYYLIAHSERHGLTHYRVDKMTEISTTDQERDGKDAFESLDMAVYARKVFGMFSGEEVAVKLRFENRLVGAVLDRLGHDVMLVADGDAHFTVRANVVVSPQFFAWVSGFGPAAQIVAPDEVVRAMAAHIRSVARQYEHIDIDNE